jgi:hypothetical protein
MLTPARTADTVGMVLRAVTDSLALTLADGTTHRLEIAAGKGESALKELIAREGVYANGWVEKNDDTWLNLSSVVSIVLRRDSDPQTQFRTGGFF